MSNTEFEPVFVCERRPRPEEQSTEGQVLSWTPEGWEVLEARVLEPRDIWAKLPSPPSDAMQKTFNAMEAAFAEADGYG